MRFLVVTIFTESLLALLLPDPAYVLLLGPLALLAAVAAIRSEALLIAPLLLALPLVALMIVEVPLRILGTLVLLALLLLALSDIAHRHKGAPLSLSRLLLWYLSGSFTLFVALFAAAADHIVTPALLLSAALLVSGGAAWLGRTTAERARAAETHRIPWRVDAAGIGIIFTELIVALAFLPLMPISLAALSVVLLWLLVRVLVSARLDELTFSRLAGYLVNTGVLVLAVLIPPVFFSSGI